jgi:SNF2 family DNA or RNA helicase
LKNRTLIDSLHPSRCRHLGSRINPKFSTKTEINYQYQKHYHKTKLLHRKLLSGVLSPAASALSGKAGLLLALLEGILSGGEKVLVFSQYVEALDCLARIIAAELGEAPLVYHGGLRQKERAAVVDRFQNDPLARVLLVSLQAGGLGLNLTAASRVIHYDLWYNPAVESQATDRAFRIGQRRDVFVHRFITKGTFEEKIDAMLSSKKELADMTVSSGESWLARMSHQELRELFGR